MKGCVFVKVRMCEIVQQLKYIDIDEMKKVLNVKGCIKDYAYIIHDKDVDDRGVLKEPHIHLALRFNNAYDTKHISQWFSVPEQYISKVKGKWVDLLKYLTHKNALGKFQYSDDEVVSNFDFLEEIKNNDKPKDRSRDERKFDIINKIVSGEIREYNYYTYISIEEYDKYKKSIDNAFRYRLDSIKGVERQMECIFITGDSGTGKTSYAKQIAKDRGFSIFISSGSNDPLDDYKGQDCIILDDLRPSCMGLSDLLKMLDNHTASTVKSRYKNKVLECRLIIITTTLSLDNFFGNVFSEEKETVVQLKRRCRLMLNFHTEYYETYIYDPYKRDYVYYGDMPNPIYLENSLASSMSRDEQSSIIASALGKTVDMVERLSTDETAKIIEAQEQLDWDNL